MSNNISQTEKLIGYIDGDMNDTEKVLLQRELGSDKSMQQELEGLLLAGEAVKHYGLTGKVAEIHKKMMNEIAATTVKQAAPIRHLPKHIMKYAAGIILLVGMFGLYQYFTITANKLYQEQYTEYNTATFRGSEAISVIEKAYQEKKYDEVIAGSKQLPDASVKDNFLTGQAYIVKENYPAAIDCFKKVLEKKSQTSKGLLSDDAEYYLALSYLKNNEIANARPLFQKIHDNKEHLYNSKVSGWFLLKLQLLKWKQ